MSDIQNNIVSNETVVDLKSALLKNDYIFDDYDFYPNKDHYGYDIIRYSSATINELKDYANKDDKCVGFNTYGYLKYQINASNFYNLPNMRYNSDGLYIKKNYRTKSTNIIFDNYDFYPNKDHYGYDIIRYSSATINELKDYADKDDKCVGFNTYGYLKYQINTSNFYNISNIKHNPDGLYVKKVLDLSTKFKNIARLIESNSDINVFLNSLALNFTENITKEICNNLPNCRITNNSDDADIYVNHYCDRVITKNNKLNIMISGESHILNDKHDVVIGTTLYQNSHINIYYPLMYSSLNEHRKSIDPLDYVCIKTKFCAFMYYVDYEHRIEYFKLISKYKHVDALSRSCNNTIVPDTRNVNNKFETFNDIAVKIYSEYKFVMAIENADVAGYFTEKMINPLIANCIPIYWGNAQVFDYINKKRVIYIKDYTDEELIARIKFLDENEDEYNMVLGEEWFVEGKDIKSVDLKCFGDIKNLFAKK